MLKSLRAVPTYSISQPKPPDWVFLLLQGAKQLLSAEKIILKSRGKKKKVRADQPENI